ncbi:MAG: elongation factor P maturation arginine rhamnosyltransferase EarP [Burkholderiaceae bacterium]
MAQARVWDLFCRVIDNFGDIGVCWRLASDLAVRGATVRLRTDAAAALRWMAPQGQAGVEVLPWSLSESQGSLTDPGDVVIEAFGCNLPDAFIRRMAARPRAPVWINLEYLTAQPFALQCHGLSSPQSVGAGAGLTKWFFHPGFVPGTGGLIRERDLESRQRDFDALAWRASKGVEVQCGERCVSLFCYAAAALPALLHALADAPTLVLATPGAASERIQQLLGPMLRRGALRAIALPWLSQPDFDHLLWSCDINFVRGEDSWVRAQWADRPFVWQAYVQSDAAQHAKLDAFLDLYLHGATPALAHAVRAIWASWNGQSNAAIVFPDAAWQDHHHHWRDALRVQPDLTTQLLDFVDQRR